MRTALFSVWWAMVGCDGGQSGENSWDPCEGSTSTKVEPTDDTLGFSAEEVIAALSSPIGVQWDEWTQEEWRTEVEIEIEPSDTLSLSGFAVGGDVRIVDFAGTRGCSHGTGKKLYVPLALRADLGGGLAATGTTELWATGTSLDQVESRGLEVLIAELSDEYAEAFDAWWLARQEARPSATDWELVDIHLSLIGPWDALELGIGARYHTSDSRSSSALWRGEVVFED